MAEWQTRTFKGRVRKSVGSSPTARTTEIIVTLVTIIFLKFESIILGGTCRPSCRNRTATSCSRLWLKTSHRAVFLTRRPARTTEIIVTLVTIIFFKI